MTKTFLKTGIAAGAVLLALAACKGGDKKADAKSADKAAVVESEYTPVTLEGTPIERMKQAMELAEASKGDGDPAMWKLSDDDTNIYFFGTVHLLPEGVNWRTDKLNTVMNDMDTLYLELDSASAQSQAQAMVGKYAVFTDGSTLTEALGDDLEKVSAGAAKMGIPLAQLDMFKPWFVGLNMTVAKMQQDGFDPTKGVEHVLTTEATAAGKTFGYLETMDDQFSALSGGTTAEQAKELAILIDTIDYSKVALDALVGEWVDGDVNGLGIMAANPGVMATRGAYDRLLTFRNEKWVPQIEAMLDQPGTKLVAVGAGHLAGPDSVITMLRNKGHKVEVVQ